MEMATGADTLGEDDERLAQDTGRYYDRLEHEMDASDLHQNERKIRKLYNLF